MTAAIHAEPLTEAAFAPFGEVFGPPATPGRTYVDRALQNPRAAAQPSLSFSLIEPLEGNRLPITLMERHAHSSQAFIALDVARYLLIVAPSAASGGPDTARARAFVASGAQSINYRAGTWHHEMMPLDRRGRFAILMWNAGVEDEEFVTIAAPFDVVIPPP